MQLSGKRLVRIICTTLVITLIVGMLSAINQKKSIADNQAVIADKVISYISVGDKDSLFEMFSQTEKTDETKNR